MTDLSLSTEDRIKEAATTTFLEKGFDGTTTRDIAKAAGLNSALVNYYFRSKEKLFAAVFSDMLNLFFQGFYEIVNKPITLKEKIAEMIEHDFQMFKSHSNLSIFIFSEVHRNPCNFLENTPINNIAHSLFAKQLQEGIDAGEVRPISIQSVFLLMVANIQFIFQSRLMTMQIHQMNDTEYDQFAIDHKDIVIDMVTNYLFLEKTPT